MTPAIIGARLDDEVVANVHACIDEAPVEETAPESQEIHEVAPAKDDHVPAMQLRHIVAPMLVEKVPGAQC